MPTRPDYTTARQNAGFGWSMSSSQGALREITGTPIREFNLDTGACIDAYRHGRTLIREMFGEDVGLPGLATPAVSYGHVNCLGCELFFPEGGEVAHGHLYGSLAEGIAALREPVDYATIGMAPFFLEFRERIAEAFPGESVHFSFGAEGPITSAYELRGEAFFIDMLDFPDLAVEFLEAVTDSILDYHRWECSLDGREPISPHGAGLCDDLASFVPPRLFPLLVLPRWDQFFSGMTTGACSAHVEDLRVEQLPFLEDIGLASFDPSISPRLTPPLFTRHSRVPYWWRLGEIHYPEMSCQDVEDFVFQSAADGASGVVSYVAETMCNETGVAKVHAFVRAGKEAKAMLDAGASREEIGRRVSPAGRENLWEAWCGYLGPKSSRGGARTATLNSER